MLDSFLEHIENQVVRGGPMRSSFDLYGSKIQWEDYFHMVWEVKGGHTEWKSFDYE